MLKKLEEKLTSWCQKPNHQNGIECCEEIDLFAANKIYSHFNERKIQFESDVAC